MSLKAGGKEGKQEGLFTDIICRDDESLGRGSSRNWPVINTRKQGTISGDLRGLKLVLIGYFSGTPWIVKNMTESKENIGFPT